MSNKTENTKEDYVIEYIKALATVEREMEPYKGHKRDLKINYVENGWLSKEDISLAVKAYRILQKGEDIDGLVDVYDNLRKSII
jgi:hypothetical protein|tara:strand:- start:339 stop:590 length:252 start_codon:yes stop_codon:yes gene_type:complete